MKNLLIILMFVVPSLSFAFDFDCVPTEVIPDIMNPEHVDMIQEISDQGKRDFKRRPINKPNYMLALNIETNFEAPLIGKDPYWGRIYFKDKDDTNIYYRDDLIAEDHYKDEKKDPNSFWHSTYSKNDINSAKGLSLVKAMGAEVNVKSVGTPFSPKTGGRINIKVKAPKTNAFNLLMDIKRSGKNVTKELIVGSQKIAFDSFKINAARNIFGISILNGVDTIQFMKGGKVVHTINQ